MAQVRKHIPKSPKQAACCTSALDEQLDSRLFKALGDPTRLRLLSCLARCARECSTTEVAECCSVDFSVVARHLSVLSEAGVLDSRKEGRTVYYKVRYAELSGALRSIADSIAECCATSSRSRGTSRCACAG